MQLLIQVTEAASRTPTTTVFKACCKCAHPPAELPSLQCPCALPQWCCSLTSRRPAPKASCRKRAGAPQRRRGSGPHEPLLAIQRRRSRRLCQPRAAQLTPRMSSRTGASCILRIARCAALPARPATCRTPHLFVFGGAAQDASHRRKGKHSNNVRIAMQRQYSIDCRTAQRGTG